jgi:hypothetical protein
MKIHGNPVGREGHGFFGFPPMGQHGGRWGRDGTQLRFLSEIIEKRGTEVDAGKPLYAGW